MTEHEPGERVVEKYAQIFANVPATIDLHAMHPRAELGMQECIRRQRKRVREFEHYAVVLRVAEDVVRKRLAQMKNGLLANRVHLEMQLERLVHARERIESGIHMDEFEQTVRRYVVAHAARVEEEDLLRGAAKQKHALPTVGTGFRLLDADCSKETRPAVTVEERKQREALVHAPVNVNVSQCPHDSNPDKREESQNVGVYAPSLSEAAAACWSDTGTGLHQNRVSLGTHADMIHMEKQAENTAYLSSNSTPDKALGSPFTPSMTNTPGRTRSIHYGTPDLARGVVSEMLVTLGVEKPSVDIILPDHCSLCKVPMVKGIGEQVLVCPRCHWTKTYLDNTAASMAFGEDSVEFNMFQYKRINHFNDALNELQGKEKSSILPAHINRIMSKMYEVFGPVSRDNITYAMVRHIVRDHLQLLRCYKHIVQITSLLSGKPPIQMSPAHETLARLIFEQMQEPFEKAPRRDRHNFLSYPFTLFKICQMLGLVELFPMLPLLRGEDKLRRQENLFCWICEYRGWVPPPSVLSDPSTWTNQGVVDLSQLAKSLSHGLAEDDERQEFLKSVAQ